MILDHKKFALFDYISNECNNPFKLGEVVLKLKDHEGNPCNEIGVVLQIHDDSELRTDMFGNECVDNLKRATLLEIIEFRPDLVK
jgi:hypothetical protein